MTVAVLPRETVPDDVKPVEVDLAVTALLLRAGLYGQEVPAYQPTDDPRAMPYGWRRVWARVGG